MMADMETKATDVDTKIALANTKLNNMDTKLENINDVNEKLYKMEANIGTKITLIDTKTANLATTTDTKLETMSAKMANLQANVEAKFEAVNTEMKGIRMSLTEMKNGFDHLKGTVLKESKERKQEEITRDVGGAVSCGRENQHIFVAGGVGQNSVEIFNYPQRLWSLLKPMPENRHSASSFVYNSHMTFAGGWCVGGLVDNMIRMNIRPVPDLSIDWSDFAAKLPVRIYMHSSVVYKNTLVCYWRLS